MKFSFISMAAGVCLLAVPASASSQEKSQAGTYTKPPPNTAAIHSSQAETYTKPPPNTAAIQSSNAGTYTKPPPNTAAIHSSQAGTYTKPPPNTAAIHSSQAETYTKPPPNTAAFHSSQAETYTKPPPNAAAIQSSDAGTYTKPPPTSVQSSQVRAHLRATPNVGVNSLNEDTTLHIWIVNCNEGQEEGCEALLQLKQTNGEIVIVTSIPSFGDFVIEATPAEAMLIQSDPNVKVVELDSEI